MRPWHTTKQIARFSSSPQRLKFSSVKILSKWSVDVFRDQAFNPSIPALLPATEGSFDFPALSKWFSFPKTEHSPKLREEYWRNYRHVPVPVEITTLGSDEDKAAFERRYLPLGLFLKSLEPGSSASAVQLYLAQCQVLDLPRPLQEDLPTPDLVVRVGKGDVYDANIWIGKSPTYTPLHRDPNPNFFLQLAGTKKARLYPPNVGASIFQLVQQKLGRSNSSAMFRGEEMMHGEERKMLEDIVWGKHESDDEDHQSYCQEVTVEGGSALFIPKGWWHSVKGVGQTVNASVNWWFR